MESIIQETGKQPRKSAAKPAKNTRRKKPIPRDAAWMAPAAGIVVITAALIVCLTVLWPMLPGQGERYGAENSEGEPPAFTAPDLEGSGMATGVSLASPGRLPPEPSPGERGTLVFVIDDAGNNLEELEPFLNFPGPLTIAVLPGLPHSVETARRIRAAGKEVFLHQPMEALGGQNPGPGAVYSGMDDEEIRAIVERNLDEIGPVAGMNNHQGSKITTDEEVMDLILDICRERGIFFLDSKTVANSAGALVANRRGIRIGERDVFLDNVREREPILQYLRSGLRLAEARRSAVMIGHTWSPELAAILTEFYPELSDRGYAFATVSRFLREGEAE